MLVLSRKPGEKIFVGGEIVISVVRIGPNTVRIGIDAPKNMRIVRDELSTQSAPSDDDDLSDITIMTGSSGDELLDFNVPRGVY